MDQEETRKLVLKYSDMLYRIGIVLLCNEQDTQDAMQDTFCRYLEKRPAFREEEHRKAWLIKVMTNICRDKIRFRVRHPQVQIDDLENTLVAPDQKSTLEELMGLPIQQKLPIYLHYVEGYQIKEIAKMLGVTEGAVKMRLKRGKEQMRVLYGGKSDE